MEVQVIPLTDFIHGHYTCRTNRAMMMPAGVASDLERAGLVRIALSHATAPTAPGKAQDDGLGQPSSVSPVAPVSPPLTSRSLKRGAAKAEKTVG